MVFHHKDSLCKCLFALSFAIIRAINSDEEILIDAFYAEYQFAKNYIECRK